MANIGWARREEGNLDGARSTFETAQRISRRNGDSRGMAHAFLGLALLAGDLGDWDRSGALHGAAQASSTGRELRGMRTTRATAGTASIKPARAWAMSGWSGLRPGHEAQP